MLLTLKKVYFSYPLGSDVLKAVSLSVNRGESVAIIGANGSGKTTLLLAAAGLLKPRKGEVLLEDKPLMDQLPEARRRIGLVFQDPDDQLFNPTVYDEIAFVPKQLLESKDMVDERVRSVAGKFKLESLLDNPPYKLSMGEKRKVTLASILSYSPELLLLDEPTANLSSGPIEEVKRVIKESKDDGKAVLLASHDVEFVAEVSDRVYIIKDGDLKGGLNVKSVLTDERLLEMADMKPPQVYQVLRLLQVKLDGNPITLEDLRKFFKPQQKKP